MVPAPSQDWWDDKLRQSIRNAEAARTASDLGAWASTSPTASLPQGLGQLMTPLCTVRGMIIVPASEDVHSVETSHAVQNGSGTQ